MTRSVVLEGRLRCLAEDVFCGNGLCCRGVNGRKMGNTFALAADGHQGRERTIDAEGARTLTGHQPYLSFSSPYAYPLTCLTPSAGPCHATLFSTNCSNLGLSFPSARFASSTVPILISVSPG